MARCVLVVVVASWIMVLALQPQVWAASNPKNAAQTIPTVTPEGQTGTPVVLPNGLDQLGAPLEQTSANAWLLGSLPFGCCFLAAALLLMGLGVLVWRRRSSQKRNA